jgi:pteridine reductase
MDKKKQIALVTGGAKRIGASICKRLHNANIDLMIHYRSSRKEAKALNDELNSIRKNSAAIIQADLCNQKVYKSIITQSVRVYGQLNFLVNNASSYYPTELGKIDESNWDDLMASNLKAPLFLCQEAAPFLKKTKGSIINITDVHIRKPKKNYIVYSIAKAGLETLTKSLAQELGPDIRVNAIAPGPILWPDESHEFDELYRKRVISQTLLKRVGESDDVAKAVEFLLLKAPFITGQIVNVDGGRSFT